MFITKVDLIICYHSYLPSRPTPLSHVLDAFGSENYLVFNHQAFLQNSSAYLLTDYPEVCLVRCYWDELIVLKTEKQYHICHMTLINLVSFEV